MEYDYDGFGRTIHVKGPNDPVYTLKFTYSVNSLSPSFGLIQSATTQHYDIQNYPNTLNTTLFVDGLGRVIQTKKDIEISGTEYRLISGHIKYDAFGRVINQYYPYSEPISNIESEFNPNIDAVLPTITEYDIMDRKTKVTLPNGISTSLYYGINAPYFLTNTTDPNGFVTSKYIDTRGLDRMIIAPDNITTKLYYNSLSELIQTIDPNNHSTFYTYNNFGQKTSRIHPDAGTDLFTYDLAGNLISRQTQDLINNSMTINYDYHYNQMTAIHYPKNPENDVYYFYGDNSATDNRKGRVYAIEDASGRQEFSYGRMGEVVKNIRTFALPNEQNTYTFTMKFEYDSWNRILGTTYPDGEQLNYFYNRGGLLKKMKSDYNNITYLYIDSIDYNKFEKRTFIQYGNGTFTEYTYDILQRLSHLASMSSNGIMQEIDYSFDHVNNITEIKNNAGILSNGLGGDYYHEYRYDNNNRLSFSKGYWNGNNQLMYDLNLTYTDDGRINQKILNAEVLLNGNQYNTNYNNEYFYNSNRPHTLESVYDNNLQSSQKFGWDVNGNLTYHYSEKPENNERNLCWDEENRLMAVKDNNYTSYYLYDNGGERTYKLTGVNMSMNINGNWYSHTELINPTLYTSGYLVANNQGYTKHYYSGSERVASAIGLGGLDNISIPIDNEVFGNWEEKVKTLKDEMDRTILECTKIEYQANQASLENLIAFEDLNSGTMARYFYHPDHLGSSSWITDGSGQAIQHLHYLPFGEDWVDQRNSTWNAPYTFSGKEKDVETGYGYFGARYYDSGLSIWLSVDPMSDKYPSMSPYNYCANNPVILVDPDGRDINLYGIKYEQGQNYKGDNKLVAAAWNMVNDINNTRLGNIIISALCRSSKTYDIRLDSKSGGEYNPKNHKISMQNSFTQLIHELFHAYLDDSGHGQQTTYNEVGARLCAFYIYNNYMENLSKGLTNEIYSSTDQLATQLPSAIFDNNILQLKKQFNNQSFDYVAKNFKKHFTGYSNISSETSDTQKNFVINFFKKN